MVFKKSVPLGKYCLSELTGITQQQTSKWHRRLQEPKQYRDMLFGAAYHKAMAETNATTTASTALMAWVAPLAPRFTSLKSLSLVNGGVKTGHVAA